MVTGGSDETARIWDTESGEELIRMKEYLSEVWSVAISPDGKKVVTGCQNGTVRIWTLE
jgi:WD40 repeat protein